MSRFVTLCPNCGANNWHQENDTIYTGDQGFYVCNECNYSGRLFPEVEVSKKDDFKKETRKGHFKVKVVKTNRLIPSLLLLTLAIVLIFISWILFVILLGIYFTYHAVKRIIFLKKR